MSQVVKTFADLSALSEAPAGGDQFLVRDISEADGDRSKTVTRDNMMLGRAQTTSTHSTEIVSKGGLLENNHNLHSHSVVSYNNNQYVAFYDESATIILAKRQLSPLGNWSFNDTATGKTTNKLDNHDYIALGVDDTGVLHIAYDMHSSALKYFKMPTAESIDGTAGANISWLGTNESEVTYPIFFNDNDGKLFLTFRDGISGDGDSYLYSYSGGSWSAASGTGTAGIFIDGKTASPDVNPYISIPYVDSNNVAHWVGHWREDPTSASNKDPFYFAYDLTNGTFNQADDSSQTVPITPLNADTMESTGPSEDVGDAHNRRACWKDVSTGYIYATFLFRDAADIQNYHLATWNGSAWVKTQITHWGETPTQTGNGGWLLVDSDETFYATITDFDRSYATSVYESRDKGVTWSDPYIIGAITRDGGNGNIDLSQWDANDIFYRLFQVMPDSGGTGSGLFPGIKRYIYLEKWDPKSGVKRNDYTPNCVFANDDVYIKSFAGGVFIPEIGSTDVKAGHITTKFLTGLSGSGIHVGNDAGTIQILNNSGDADEFAANIEAYPGGANDRNFTIRAFIDPTYDSGTNPCIQMQAKQDDSTDITTRPLLNFYNNSTLVLSLQPDGSIGVNGVPDSNAVMDLQSTTKPFMPPRMTTTQRDAVSSPQAGMTIYNSTTNVLNFYNGSAWGAV